MVKLYDNKSYILWSDCGASECRKSSLKYNNGGVLEQQNITIFFGAMVWMV
mgnify:CR=1 FL=1